MFDTCNRGQLYAFAHPATYVMDESIFYGDKIMKQIKWMLSFGLMVLALFATSAYAESPREQLNQMVQQLQQNPTDNALREKIIALAQTIKPAPTVPEEAIRHEGCGKFAFRNAKSSGFLAQLTRRGAWHPHFT